MEGKIEFGKEGIDFAFIVNENIHTATKFFREGKAGEFFNTVEALSMLLDSYKDEQFEIEMRKAEEKKKESEKQVNADKKKIMLEYYKTLFVALIHLVPRTEIWPTPSYEAVITKKDIEEAEKVQYIRKRGR